MKLYILGYNNHREPDGPIANSTTSDRVAPICILKAEVIQILWTSWCDAIIAYQSSEGIWTIQYRGTSLPPELQEHIANSVPICDAVSGHRGILQFFGSTLHDGLRGYLIKYPDNTASEICIFSTDLEVEAGASLIRTYSSPTIQNISAIQIDSSGHVLLGLDHSSNETQILHFANLNDLTTHLNTASPFHSPPQHLAPFIPTQWLTNATTSTALTHHGRIFTSSRDLRFPKSLGRTPINAHEFDSIPYFSETRIQAISSGGYMSGAISTEGELFLWGQSIPGSDGGSFTVLEDDVAESGDDDSGGIGTGVSCAPEQDEIVKCLDVYVDSVEARAYRLAVGHGHVFVAAEVKDVDGETKRVVLGAGVNSNGQLGFRTSTKFVEDFEEISAFRDMAIQQLVATGWSTFVVTL